MFNKRGGMTVWLIFLILSTLVMGFLLRSSGTVAGLPLGLVTAAGWTAPFFSLAALFLVLTFAVWSGLRGER